MKCSQIIALLCVLLGLEQAACSISDDVKNCKCKPAGLLSRDVIPTDGNIDLSSSTPTAAGVVFGVGLKLYTLRFAPPSTPAMVTFSMGVKGTKCMAILQTGCGCNDVLMEGHYMDVEINPTGTFTSTHTYPGTGSTSAIPASYWLEVADWFFGLFGAPADTATHGWGVPVPDCLNINVNILLVGDCAPGVTEADIISDHHIMSWDRVGQTVFHEGDFLLAESLATGLAVHGRFCRLSLGPWAPWTCAIAVRCDGESAPVEVAAAAWGARTYSTAAQVTDSAGVRTISCSSGLSVQMTRHHFHRFPYLNARLSLDPRRQSNLADLRGLLGSPNANRTDELIRRDGRSAAVVAGEHLIGHTSAALDDVHESWRVRSSERLFSSAFTVNGIVAASIRRPLPLAATRAAHSACKTAGLTDDLHVAACAHDTVLLQQRRSPFAKDLVEFEQALADEAAFPLQVDYFHVPPEREEL